MRSAGLVLVAILGLAAPDPIAAARSGEDESRAPARGRADHAAADWVIDVTLYYMDHLCVHPWSYCPQVNNVPWAEVAWGAFEFELRREGGFGSAKSVPCELSYGGESFPVYTEAHEECSDWKGCYLHTLTVSGLHQVVRPTHECDFGIFLWSDHCDIACGSYACEPFGSLTGTLYLYAEPTAIGRAAWSTIKANY